MINSAQHQSKFAPSCPSCQCIFLVLLENIHSTIDHMTCLHSLPKSMSLQRCNTAAQVVKVYIIWEYCLNITECTKVFFFLMMHVHVMSTVWVAADGCIRRCLYLGASILLESVCNSRDAYVEWLWSGSKLGCIPHGGRIAPGNTPAMEHSENTHVGTHTYRHILYSRGRSQLEAMWDRGATVFHETGEWAAKHHTCQLLSSRQHPGNQT